MYLLVFPDFIYSLVQIETVGYFGPVDVVREALLILKEKSQRLEAALRAL